MEVEVKLKEGMIVSKHAAFWVTIALILADLMAGLDATIINTAVPAIIADLDGIQFYGWIVAVFLLGVAASAPLWGKLGERIGNGWALNLSLGLFIVSSILAGSADNIIIFIVARAIMGIGGGGMGVLPYIMAAKVFADIHQRTKVLGYIAGAFSLASIAGPLLGGVIVDGWSWRGIFYINVPIGLVAIGIIMAAYREVRSQLLGRFDFLGALLLVGGLCLALGGLQLVGLASPVWVVGLMVGGVAALVALFFVEKNAVVRHVDPLLPGRIFKNKELMADFWLFVLSWGAFIAVNTYTPFWSQSLLQTTALLGGMVLIPNALADFVGTQVAAWFQVHFSASKIITISFVAMILSTAGLAAAAVNASYWYLMIAAMFSGFGVGLVFVILQVKVQADAPPQDLASATSISYLVRILAQTVMAAVYGVLLNWQLARGVAQSHGKVTLSQLNALSSKQSAANLAASLLPKLHAITHAGLVTIMLVATLLLVIALGCNYYCAKLPTQKKRRAPLSWEQYFKRHQSKVK